MSPWSLAPLLSKTNTGASPTSLLFFLSFSIPLAGMMSLPQHVIGIFPYVAYTWVRCTGIIFHLWISSAWKAGTQDLFGLTLTPVVYSALGLWSLRAWGLRQMDPTGLESSPSPDHWLSLLRSVQADHCVRQPAFAQGYI